MAAGGAFSLAIFFLSRGQGLRQRVPWLIIAASFGWFAGDDIAAIHEVVGRRTMASIINAFTSSDVTPPSATSLVLYAPVFIGAFLSIVAVVRTTSRATPMLAR